MREVAQLIKEAAQEELNRRLAEDLARPIGENRIDVDFYDRAHAHRLRESYRGDEIKWSAVLVRWTGDRWKRVRRLTGPLDFEPALSECSRLCRQRGLGRV